MGGKKRQRYSLDRNLGACGCALSIETGRSVQVMRPRCPTTSNLSDSDTETDDEIEIET